MTKKEVEVVLEDPNIPVKDWDEYKKLVEEGKLEEPKDIQPKGRPDYHFNVDQALDNIDLTFNGYTPSKDAIEFFNTIRLVLGSEPEVPNSLMHYFLVDLVFGNIKREEYPYSKEIRDKIRLNNRKIAIIASRGTAKSTIISTYLPIYLAIRGSMPNFGKVSFVVAFGDSQFGGAKVIAQSVRALCEDSDFCKEYFERMRFTDDECEFIRRGNKKLNKRSFMYKTKGASAGVRGIRYRGERPSLLLMDDIIKNEADANSSIIMKKLRSMIFADAENALSGHKGKIIAVNTPFNKKDPIYSALESGVWTPVCLPICEKISLDLKEEEYVGAWPHMHPYARVKERYEDAYYGGTLREFNQELMLRISSGEDKMIKDGMLQWYDRSSIMKNLDNFTILITTDFTASNSLKGDFSGIAVWAIGPDDDKFLLDLELKKRSIQDQYNALFRMVSKWSRSGRLIEVGIEVDGQQKLNLFALKKMMIEKNLWFRFARQKGASASSEGIMSRAAGGNKLERFKYMMPSFEQKKIFFPNELKNTEDMKEMLEELQYLTYEGIGSKHDDACFVAGTPIRMADGSLKSIEDVKRGDEVMTFGSDTLTSLANHVIMTPSQLVFEYSFDDGTSVVCTPNHRVLTRQGWTAINEVPLGESIISVEGFACEQSTMDTNGLRKRQDTTNLRQILTERGVGCTNMYGASTMGNNLKDTMYTIKTETKTTILQKILNLFQRLHTRFTMGLNGQRGEKQKRDSISLKLGTKHQNGMLQQKGENGTDSTGRRSVTNYLLRTKNENVLGAVSRLCRTLKRRMCTVTVNANFSIRKQINGTTHVNAQNAEKNLCGIDISQPAQTNAANRGFNEYVKNATKNLYARSAALISKLTQQGRKVSAQKVASVATEQNRSRLWQIDDVKSAEQYIHQNTKIASSANLSVVERTITGKKEKGKQNVYNFEVLGSHNYVLGNGLVAHNCDLISQLGMIEYTTPVNGVGVDEQLTDVNETFWGILEEDTENTNSMIF